MKVRNTVDCCYIATEWADNFSSFQTFSWKEGKEIKLYHFRLKICVKFKSLAWQYNEILLHYHR